MNFIDKLERKFGHLGIRNLMYYIVILNIISVLLNLFVPDFCYQYLTLDIDQILHVQVWRIVTFLFAMPVKSVSGFNMQSMVGLFWFAIWVGVYYFIGTTIENMWGSFRFTLFMVSGVVFVVLVSIFSYLFLGALYSGFPQDVLSYYIGARVSLTPLYSSMFLAFALMFPDIQFMVYFIIPVKAKWLAAVYLILDIYQIYHAMDSGDYVTVALIIGALINVTIFYVFARGKSGVKAMYQQKRRKQKFSKKVREASPIGRPIHRCAICGRTEKDDPRLEFRYCSKCEGSYEYCSEHLYTHEHVREKTDIN